MTLKPGIEWQNVQASDINNDFYVIIWDVTASVILYGPSSDRSKIKHAEYKATLH